MRAGLGRLRLAPGDFWAMTPRELSAALEGAFGLSGAGAPTRSEVAELMRRFPD
jgi:uncharacterized phage protein (TIGR02216 family)